MPIICKKLYFPLLIDPCFCHEMIFLTKPSLIIQYMIKSFAIDSNYYKEHKRKTKPKKNKTVFFNFWSPWTYDLNIYGKNIETRNWNINCTEKNLVSFFFLVFICISERPNRMFVPMKKKMFVFAIFFFKIPVSVQKMNVTSLRVAPNKEVPVISTL